MKYDTENNGDIVIYQSEDGATKINVNLQDETVWLSQQQLVELYHASKSNISEHIKHIFDEGELQESLVVRKFRTTAKDGKNYLITYYNLDMIISLGYRIKSSVATRFRIWATQRLKEYMIKGFTMDDERLKGNHGHTAAEIIFERADSNKPFMGLTSFSGDFPSEKDISIAKNYLDEKELMILKNLVSGYFDLAEINAMEHKPMYMKDYIRMLDNLLITGERKVLSGPGTMSNDKALEKAFAEYRKYQVNTLSPVEEAYLKTIKETLDTIES